VRVAEVEVGEDDLDSLVTLRDERVSTEHVGGVRVRVVRRRDHLRLRRLLAFTAPPCRLTAAYKSIRNEVGIHAFTDAKTTGMSSFIHSSLFAQKCRNNTTNSNETRTELVEKVVQQCVITYAPTRI